MFYLPRYFYSVMEIHDFLVTLISKLEFALPDTAPRVRRLRPGFLIPVVDGEKLKGPQLTLRVTLLRDA